jgi:aspartate/methionine/tyrosine aminotransferase
MLYASRRDYAVKRLGEVAGVRPVRAEGGFYLTIDVWRRRGANAVRQ